MICEGAKSVRELSMKMCKDEALDKLAVGKFCDYHALRCGWAL